MFGSPGPECENHFSRPDGPGEPVSSKIGKDIRGSDMKTIRLKNRPENSSPCIWTQAKVVRKKNCGHDYECIDCRFDRIMHKTAQENKDLREAGHTPAGARGRIVFWKDNFRKLQPWHQPCIHHMKGKIEFRACHNSYNCSNCDFDQFFYDQYTVHAVIKPVDVLSVHGFRVPHGYYLHRGHAWVKLEESETVRIGADDFTIRLFGPFDRIVSPLMGKEIRQGQPDIVLKRGEKEARMLSPVSGVVTAINSDLREKGDLTGEDAYSAGWIMRVRTQNLRKDLGQLMIGDETTESLEKDVSRLYEIIEESAGPLAADGGLLGENIYGNLPQMNWERLAQTFLRT